MKKLLSLVLVLLFIVGTASPTMSADGSPFSDVKEKRWSYKSIIFAYENKLMDGVGGGRFDPSGSMTRGMVVTVLHRMEGKPAIEFKNDFSDVKAGRYYSNAVIWAKNNSIVNGISEGIFSPEGEITREQLATMLFRYAEFKGYDISAGGDLSKFPDADAVHSYARGALFWATSAGIITGVKSGDFDLLDPRGPATREQFATILARFIPKYENEEKEAVDPLYEKAETLRSAEICGVHGAAIHVQFGPPEKLKEAEIGVSIVEGLGLDRTIYEFRFTGDGYSDFISEYSKVRDGEGITIPLSFEINNTRTLGEPARLDSVPVCAIRNDKCAAAHTVECCDTVLRDEELDCKLEEFDSLYVCETHGCVHLEADELTESGFEKAVTTLMGLDPDEYAIRSDTSFESLKTNFDALSVGEISSDNNVTFAVSNEKMKDRSGNECLSDQTTVKVSVMKVAEHFCGAVACPYGKADKSFELFERKYICGEHGVSHVTLNHGGDPTVSGIETLIKAALDLGAEYDVTVDPDKFASGIIDVTARHVKGYEKRGLTFSAEYSVDEASPAPAKFTLCENDRDAYKLILHDGYDGNTGYGGWNHGQPESGWTIDTRADDSVRHGTINDVSATESSQVIREINNTVKGVINHRCSVRMISGFDGAVLDFRNADGNSVCRLQTIGGTWKILKRDGSYETVLDPEGETLFVFDLKIDLVNETVRIVINDTDFGAFPLSESGVNANVQNFRFASTKEDTVTFSMGLCETFVNYSLYEIFNDQHLFSALPAGWEYENAETVSNTGIDTADNKKFDRHLSLGAGGSVKKSFEATSDKVIARFDILPSLSGCDTEYVLRGGGEELVRVTADDASFYVNGEKAYDYLKNVWYSFYLVCDTETGRIVFNVNGVDRGEYSLLRAGVPLDEVSVVNYGTEAVLYDGFFVYNEVYHSDYVPEPVVPAGEEEYNVGINVCSMWQNGFHAGWACITPFDDTRPVLGYYDEGSPETADWEIKYLLEHGVDFQSYVLYALEENSPITGALGVHLEDGFKHAKYSGMTKYSLIWCSATPSSPRDLDAWKTYYVPYLIEHHFRDPRYLVIDNMPVLFFFRFVSADNSQYWTVENRKAALDYLDEQVRLLGYDGVLYIDADETMRQTHASEGFQGIYSYHHDTAGAFFESTKERILKHYEEAKAWGLSYVPTVSTGFNRIGWMQPRTSVMDIDDYRKTNAWVKEEFLPANSDSPHWARNLMIISNWNEYGEGTYIMPCEDHYGFGYLDVLRETYTSESADPSLNVIPSTAQLERINRLYPQHQKLVRAQEYEVYSNGVDIEEQKRNLGSETVARLDPADVLIRCDDNITTDGKTIKNVSGKRGKAVFALTSPIDLSMCESIDVLAYLGEGVNCLTTFGKDAGTKIEPALVETLNGKGKDIYWFDITECGSGGDAIQFNMPDGMIIYEIRITCGTLTLFSDTLTVNETDIPMKVFPDLSPRGDYLFGFDTIFTDLHLFGMFAQWDDADERLTLSLPGNEFVFTVGSAFFTLNGEERFLGYKIYMKDGVPMIPLNIITERIGATIVYSDIRNAIVTY